MDRDLLYPGQIGLVENFLDAFKYAMISDGILAEAILGQSTQVFGLAATALSNTAVSGSAFAVSIGRGGIFSYQETDPNAYGVLGADTATNIVKTGINLTATNIGVTNSAPATAGQSINYLISAEFSETDSNSVNLPFYNAGGTPTLTTENGTRVQRVVFRVTGGPAAATGSQTTPAAPAGAVPLYVVTVTNGQTAVAAGNIEVVPTAPFINNLANKPSGFSNMVQFSAAGAISWTPPAGITLARVSVTGGGGGAAGGGGTTNNFSGGGGGAGGWGRGYHAVTPGVIYSGTVGAGGSGGGNLGGTGGSTTFLGMTATGGSGGSGSSSNCGGGAGGSCTGAQESQPGGGGGDGNPAGGDYPGGIGGGNPNGTGGRTGIGFGLPGSCSGTGGGGCYGAAGFGGAGAPGSVTIEY